jgi:shikimate 5-dehydrogenase
LSRARHRALGSAWTYVSAGAATAEGQLDVTSVERLGLSEAASSPCFALVGGPSVAASPGVQTYNRLFRKLGLPHSYLAACCRSLANTLPVLERFGVTGLSVTMPHKLAALTLCLPDEQAHRVGAVNSMRWRDGRWHGHNSDVAGVREPLARALSRQPNREPVLVLGAGGAARAAVEACRQLRLEVVVSARRLERASALGVGTCAWHERATQPHGVLINATSLGGDESPWPEGQPLAPLIFELALHGDRLLQQGRAAGRVVLTPRMMWLAQGAEQMSWLLDRTISAEQLREHLPATEAH